MAVSPLSTLLLLLAVALAAVEAEPSLLRNNNNKASTATLIASQNSTGCARLGQLPEECHCHEPGHHQLKIECLKQFSSMVFNDTIGLMIDLDPCNADGSRLNVDLVELNHNIHYTVAGISAGDEEDYPIPGLAVVVPGVGHIGMDLAVMIEGNPDMLRIKLGLDACIALPSHQLCAESIPGLNMILPWYVLSGNYTFSDICEQADTDVEDQQDEARESVATK